MNIIWWHNSLSFFCYYNFFLEKGFRLWPKKNPSMQLVGTIGLHSNPGISFMSLAVKGMIRIANEESNCLSSFVILIMPLITMLIKEVPESEGFFWPKSETFFWKEIVITEEWKRVMPPNYVHKIVHISALFYQSLSIISASGRRLLKMKNSKSFFNT